MATCYSVILSVIFLCTEAAFQRNDYENFTVESKYYYGRRLTQNLGFYDQCYVDVRVFNSTTYKHGLLNATVTVFSGPINRPPNFTEFSQSLTNADGKVCLSVRCHQESWIFVDKNAGRLKPANLTIQKDNIPSGFVVTLPESKEILQYHSYYFGGTGGKTGPIYMSFQKEQCETAGTSNHYFVFSYIAFPDQLVSTPVPVQFDPFKNPSKLAWRYGLSGDQMTCYFKVKVSAMSTDVVVRAFSKLVNQQGEVLGLFETGPQYDVALSGTLDKAACVMFRCPALDISTNEEYSTYIEGTIEVPDRPGGCCYTSTKSLFVKVNDTSFRTSSRLEYGNNYGVPDGIYRHLDTNIARIRCFTGQMVLLDEYPMNTSTGAAFEYDCKREPDCYTHVILGKK